MSREAGYDRTLTVFSPEGRLYQIEYAFKAAKAPGLTSIGVRGEDAVALITQKKVQDKLIDASSITSVFKLTEHIACVSTGQIPDARSLVQKARQMAAEFEFNNGYPIPVAFLAKKIADENQIYTQHAYRRSLAVILILAAVDDEKGPQLFKVDPAGHFLSFKATAAGAKEADAMNALEKRWKDVSATAGEGPIGEGGSAPAGTPKTSDETVRLAISSMQGVLSSDFKASEVEVVLVKKGERVKVLSEAEVEAHLTAIAEQD